MSLLTWDSVINPGLKIPANSHPGERRQHFPTFHFSLLHPQPAYPFSAVTVSFLPRSCLEHPLPCPASRAAVLGAAGPCPAGTTGQPQPHLCLSLLHPLLEAPEDSVCAAQAQTLGFRDKPDFLLIKDFWKIKDTQPGTKSKLQSKDHSATLHLAI